MSRFVEEIDPQYIMMPRAHKSAFPKPGNMPRSFFGGGEIDEARSYQGSGFVRKKTPTQQTSFTRKSQPEKNVNQPKGPTMGNTPAEINAIQAGMTVSHAKFGIGKVISVEGAGDSRKAIIFFDNIGQKQLMLKFAKLSIV